MPLIKKVFFSISSKSSSFSQEIKGLALAWPERRSFQLVPSPLTKGRVYSAHNFEKVANIITDY